MSHSPTVQQSPVIINYQMTPVNTATDSSTSSRSTETAKQVITHHEDPRYQQNERASLANHHYQPYSPGTPHSVPVHSNARIRTRTGLWCTIGSLSVSLATLACAFTACLTTNYWILIGVPTAVGTCSCVTCIARHNATLCKRN
jgi:hypothetical protein